MRSILEAFAQNEINTSPSYIKENGKYARLMAERNEIVRYPSPV